MKLFIIGNGFDISHGLETSYDHFKKFLESRYPHGNHDWGSALQRIFAERKFELSDNEKVSFIKEIIFLAGSEANGKDWGDLEGALSRLNLNMFFDDGDEPYSENTFLDNHEMSALLSQIIADIVRYFNIWIPTINVVDRNPNLKLNELADWENDLFLTFNYTPTLEKLYQAKNVCHIHGKQNEKLYFGHGVEDIDEEYRFLASPYGESKYFGADLSNLFAQLRKNTKEAISNNKCFYKTLKESAIDSIFSIGFSFSEVDLIYLKKICKTIDSSSLTWFLNDYNYEKTKGTILKQLKEAVSKGNLMFFL